MVTCSCIWMARMSRSNSCESICSTPQRMNHACGASPTGEHWTSENSHGNIIDLFAAGLLEGEESLLSNVAGGAKKKFTSFLNKINTTPCHVCFNCGMMNYPAGANIVTFANITRKEYCRV